MIGIIIDAKSEDSVFPNKIFHRFGGRTVLEMVTENALRCELAHRVIVTMPSSDKSYIVGTSFKDPVIDTGLMRLKRRAHFHFLESKDILSRMYNAALEHGLDHVVRIAADCPVLPTWLYSEMILNYKMNNLNCYMSNVKLPFDTTNFGDGCYQSGLNVEIIPFWMLASATINCMDKESYQEYLCNQYGLKYFKMNDAKDGVLPHAKFDLRLKSKEQIVKFDYLITELNVGTDLGELLEEDFAQA
jgi:spore coat polysaccharide biosynthesis protein SpsF (cytidylyltransferase family)